MNVKVGQVYRSKRSGRLMKVVNNPHFTQPIPNCVWVIPVNRPNNYPTSIRISNLEDIFPAPVGTRYDSCASCGGPVKVAGFGSTLHVHVGDPNEYLTHPNHKIYGGQFVKPVAERGMK